MRYLLLLLIFIETCPVFGQETYDLKKCISVALANNTNIKTAYLNSDLAQNALNNSKVSKLPTFESGIYQAANFGRSIDRFTNGYINQLYNSTYGTIQMNLPLFTGFQNLNYIEAAKSNIEANKYNIEIAKNTLILQVMRAYFEYMAADELLAVANLQLLSSENQLDRQNSLFKAGMANRLEQNQAQVQEKTDAFGVINAKNNLEIARLSLFQTLNLRIDQNISFKRTEISPLIQITKSNYEEVFKTKNNLPIFKSLDWQKTNLDQRIKTEKGRRLPRLDLYTNYNLFYASTNPDRNFGEQLNDNRNGSVSLGLSIPIARKLINEPIVQNLRIQQRIIENNRTINEVALDKEIEMATLVLSTAQNSFEISEQQVLLTQEALELVEQRLSSGTIQFIEFTNAKNNLDIALSRQIQSKYRILLQTIILQYYKAGNFDFYR